MNSASAKPLLTPEQARERLLAHGVNVAAFARQHGIKPAAVYAVLYGLNKGRRGESHRAAVALGIKPDLSAAEQGVL